VGIIVNVSLRITSVLVGWSQKLNHYDREDICDHALSSFRAQTQAASYHGAALTLI